MITPNLDLNINQGATFRHELRWEEVAGVPVDLTGYTARMQIRSELASATIIISLTTANEGIVLGGVTGTIRLYISDTVTSALTILTSVYDLELISPSSDVTRLLSGNIALSLEITR